MLIEDFFFNSYLKPGKYESRVSAIKQLESTVAVKRVRAQKFGQVINILVLWGSKYRILHLPVLNFIFLVSAWCPDVKIILSLNSCICHIRSFCCSANIICKWCGLLMSLAEQLVKCRCDPRTKPHISLQYFFQLTSAYLSTFPLEAFNQPQFHLTVPILS